jgi:hypothetical protein
MKNIQKIIDLFGGVERFPALKIENEPYMALCIEQIGPGPHGYPQVSVAHNGEQNGDLMRDPDLVCEVYPDGQWVPVSFRNDYVGMEQEVYGENAQGQTTIKPKLLKDLTTFARQWDRTIGEQRFVEAALRQRDAITITQSDED